MKLNDKIAQITKNISRLTGGGKLGKQNTRRERRFRYWQREYIKLVEVQ